MELNNLKEEEIMKSSLAMTGWLSRPAPVRCPAILTLLLCCLLLCTAFPVSSPAKDAGSYSGEQGKAGIPISFSAVGNGFAAAGKGGVIKVWDRETGKLMKTLKGDAARIDSLAFSPAAEGTIAAGTDDGSIELWDVQSGQFLRTLKGHQGSVTALAFSGDGELLASGGEDQTVKVWQMKGGKMLKVLKGHQGCVNTVAFSYDGQLIASGGEDRLVKIWKVQAGQAVNTWKGHEGAISSVSFSGDGTMVASSSEDSLRLWETQKKEAMMAFEQESVKGVAFSPNPSEKALASAVRDQVWLWDIAQGRRVAAFKGHRSNVTSVVFAPNGRFVAAAGQDGTIRVWMAKTQESVCVIDPSGAAVPVTVGSPEDTARPLDSKPGSGGPSSPVSDQAGSKTGAMAGSLSSPPASGPGSASGPPPSDSSTDMTPRTASPSQLQIAGIGVGGYNGIGRIEPKEVAEVSLRIANPGPGIVQKAKARLVFGPDVLPATGSPSELDVGDVPAGGEKVLSFSCITSEAIKSGSRIPVAVVFTSQRDEYAKEVPLNMVMNAGYTASPKSTQYTQQEVRVAQSVPGAPNKRISETELPVRAAEDLALAIPAGRFAGPNDIAVLIGIRNYQRAGVPELTYAHQDLQMMKEYLIKTLNFDPANIIEERDATKGVFEALFGTRENPQGKLSNWVKQRDSRVLIYYVGHGAPDPETSKAYFVPADADPDYIGTTGYPVELFYANLAKIQVRESLIVLDSCFSGQSPKGAIITKVSPALLRVKAPTFKPDHGVIMASSQPDQLSVWYEEKRHSLFTYFFLKGLRGEADANRDKMITVQELENYLAEHVPDMARKLAGRNQEPVIEGDKDMVLVRFE